MIGARLRKLVGDGFDLDKLYAEFQAERGDADPSTFARWLHDRGHLSPKGLLDYLLANDVNFTISEAIGHSREAATSRYDLLGLLGRGAMGEVHVARDRDLNRNVAVKLMDPGLAGDPKLARRFYTEAQVTAQLDHPSIVPVFGVERAADGTLGYAMRIVRGRTLRDFLAETRAFYEKGQKPSGKHALQSRLLIFEDLCNALHYAHSRGVLHRDLKPDNVMVGPYGEVLIMDWGVAKIIGTTEDNGISAGPVSERSESRRGPHSGAPERSGGASEQATAGRAQRQQVDGTEVGDAVGTPRYMSPEQAEGMNDKLDARSDQYALGLLLFELVALKSANPGTNAVTSWTAARKGKLLPFEHAYGEPIPKDLQVIVAKATAHKRAERYADVGQLAEDVRRFLRDEALLARPDTFGQRVLRSISRNRRTVALALVGLLVALILGVSGTISVGVSALGAYAYVADQREEALGRQIHAVSDQAHAIDTELDRYAGEVRGLRAATEMALSMPSVPERAVYYAEDFHAPDRAPPDAAPSRIYDAPVSLGFPDNPTAPGLDRTALALRLQQLQQVQPQMLGMLLRSEDPALLTASPDAQRAAVLERGVPMIWTYVATEDGILTGMPGVGDYPDGYDPRQQLWYQTGMLAKDLAWSVDEDESGQGLLLSVTSPLVLDGRRIGVAALDLRLSRVTEELLAPAADSATEAVLIDDQGQVVASTRDPEIAKTKPKFRHPEVFSAVRAGEPAGWRQLDGELVVWVPVETLGWTYAVAGPW